WMLASAATRMSDQIMGANLAGDGPEAVPRPGGERRPHGSPAAAPRRSLAVSREPIRHDAPTGCRAPVGPEPAAGRLEGRRWATLGRRHPRPAPKGPGL